MKHASAYRHPQRGFIALMSAVVISAILLAIMASVGMASFYARFDALGLENKRAALALAESCVNVALLALATSTDPSHYVPVSQTVAIGRDAWGSPMTCIIGDIIHTGSDATIEAYASSDNSYESISATVSLLPSIQVISWEGSD